MKRRIGRGIKLRESPDGMNKTERAYRDRLEMERMGGEIRTWRFEPVKFKLGRACFYSPDFEVVRADGTLEYHEVKGGHWEDDARVKIKTAADLFPDRRFLAVQRLPAKAGGGWKVEEIPPAGVPAPRGPASPARAGGRRAR